MIMVSHCLMISERSCRFAPAFDGIDFDTRAGGSPGQDESGENLQLLRA